MVIFAVGWLQFSVNVFVYFLKHKDSTMVSHVGRFPVHPALVSPPSSTHGNLRSNNNNNNNNNSKQYAAAKDVLSVSALEAQLSNLVQRLPV